MSEDRVVRLQRRQAMKRKGFQKGDQMVSTGETAMY